jgi:FkbM family methyltransferase
MHYNNTPDMTRMTRHVASLRLFKDEPFVLMDIGAREGLKSHWEAFFPDIKVLAFELDPVEAARLEKLPRNYTMKIFPHALARQSGRRELHVHRDPYSSSLFRENKSFIDRLMLRDAFEIVSTEMINAKCIDDIRGDLGDVDFVDIDTEGAELEIFSGGKSLLTDLGLLGLFTEVRFHEGFNTPVFSEVDLFLRSCGFSLYDLGYYLESRRALPYPLLMDKRDAADRSVKIFGVTTHGQIVFGDALYFRDSIASGTNLKVEKILKQACVFEIFGKNDCAAELILANKDKVDRVVPHADLIELLVAEMAGGRFKYGEYIDRYMKHDDAFRPIAVPERKPSLGEKLRALFR